MASSSTTPGFYSNPGQAAPGELWPGGVFQPAVILADPVSFEIGEPYAGWAAGNPYGGWQLGDPWG